MKILLLCGDYYHPADVPVAGTKPLTAYGIAVDVIRDASAFDVGMLGGYNAVIVSKCDHVSDTDQTSWKTEAVQRGFAEYAERGGGLVFVHNGIVAGEHTEIMDKLAGCRFKFHPANCPVTFWPLKPHVVTSDIDPFISFDEHYHLDILDLDIDIIGASYSSAQGVTQKYEEDPYNNHPECLMPAAFLRKSGRGRVCVITGGHTKEAWLHPMYQRLLVNSLKFCAGSSALVPQITDI